MPPQRVPAPLVSATPYAAKQTFTWQPEKTTYDGPTDHVSLVITLSFPAYRIANNM